MRNLLTSAAYLLVAAALLLGTFALGTTSAAQAAVPASVPALVTVAGTTGQGGNVADFPLADLSGTTGRGGNA